MYCLLQKKKKIMYIYIAYFCQKIHLLGQVAKLQRYTRHPSQRKKRSLNPRWEEYQKGNEDLPFHSVRQPFWTVVCKVPIWEATHRDCTHKTPMNLCVLWRSIVHLHQRAWPAIKSVNWNIMFLHKRGNYYSLRAWRF